MHEHETVCVEPLCLELTWHAGLLIQVKLRWSRPGDAGLLLTNRSAAQAKWLQGYLAGRPEPCPQIPLDWGRLSAFSRQVLVTLQARVPAGQWLSYGELAKLCGCPGAARAVGRVMAANPWPLLVPCHRVLGSAGQMTGFRGGLDIKRFLLKIEGTRFSPSD
jgi:methylated-DNA-[protein]-cysteine S-methyltransferase